MRSPGSDRNAPVFDEAAACFVDFVAHNVTPEPRIVTPLACIAGPKGTLHMLTKHNTSSTTRAVAARIPNTLAQWIDDEASRRGWSTSTMVKRCIELTRQHAV